MKYKFFALLALGLVSWYGNQPKKFTIQYTFTPDQLRSVWGKLDTIQNIVNASNMPHQNALYILNAVEELKQDINKQIEPQIADSIRRKNNK